MDSSPTHPESIPSLYQISTHTPILPLREIIKDADKDDNTPLAQGVFIVLAIISTGISLLAIYNGILLH
jgi:hypothetical protein